MWRSFFLAIGAYCCLLGVESLAIEKAVLKVDANSQSTWREVVPPEWRALEHAGRRRRRDALFVYHSATGGRRRLINRGRRRKIAPRQLKTRRLLSLYKMAVLPRK